MLLFIIIIIIIIIIILCRYWPSVEILYALNVLDITLQIHTGALCRRVILDVQTVFRGMTCNYEYWYDV